MARRKQRNRHLDYLKGSVGVSVSAPKTTAIFFDRVVSSLERMGDAPPSVLADISLPILAGMADQAVIQLRTIDGRPRALPWLTEEGLEATLRLAPERIVHGLSAKGLRPALCYRHPQGFAQLFNAGDQGAVVASLSGIKIIDEDCLHWEQVMELRADPISRSRVVRLFRWFNLSFNGKSRSALEDDLAAIYEGYERSLSKFGIAFRAIGRAATSLTPKEMACLGVGFGAIMGGASLTAGPVAGALAAGGVTIGNLVARFRSEHTLVKLEYDALAFLIDLSDSTTETESWDW